MATNPSHRSSRRPHRLIACVAAAACLTQASLLARGAQALPSTIGSSTAVVSGVATGGQGAADSTQAATTETATGAPSAAADAGKTLPAQTAVPPTGASDASGTAHGIVEHSAAGTPSTVVGHSAAGTASTVGYVAGTTVSAVGSTADTVRSTADTVRSTAGVVGSTVQSTGTGAVASGTAVATNVVQNTAKPVARALEPSTRALGKISKQVSTGVASQGVPTIGARHAASAAGGSPTTADTTVARDGHLAGGAPTVRRDSPAGELADSAPPPRPSGSQGPAGAISATQPTPSAAHGANLTVRAPRSYERTAWAGASAGGGIEAEIGAAATRPELAPAAPPGHSPVRTPGQAPAGSTSGGSAGAIFLLLTCALALAGLRAGRRLRLASEPLGPAPLILGLERPG